MKAIELPNWRVYQREHQTETQKRKNAIARKCYYNQTRLSFRNKTDLKRTKRIISVTLYDGRLYAKFSNKQAKIRYKLQIECDSLWDKFCSLESLISVEAFRTIERINQIEYLTV